MDALIVVDVQNDFMPDGPLPTQRGHEVVPVLNELQDRFSLVVATQDWHPPNHGSFASNHPGREPGEVIELDGLDQILWPDHCVQGSRGAELVEGLEVAPIEAIVRKGTAPRIDSYSGFYDNGHRKATGLGAYLEGRGVEEVWIAGVATDVCVAYTTLDACRLGFRTRVIEDACRGVELHDGDVRRALDEMRRAGATIVGSTEIGAT